MLPGNYAMGEIDKDLLYEVSKDYIKENYNYIIDIQRNSYDYRITGHYRAVLISKEDRNELLIEKLKIIGSYERTEIVQVQTVMLHLEEFIKSLNPEIMTEPGNYFFSIEYNPSSLYLYLIYRGANNQTQSWPLEIEDKNNKISISLYDFEEL